MSMPIAEVVPTRREPADARLLAALGAAFLLALAIALATGAGGWSWPLIEELRLPRVLAGAGTGALLALAGLALQLLLRNPLADPYVLGASAGAGLGAIAMLLLWGSQLWLGSAAGALLALALLLWLGRRALASAQEEASAQLILIGAMLSALGAAVATLLLALVPEQSLRGTMFWLLGDLSGARGGVWLCLLALLLALPLGRRARSFDRLALGAEQAWLLGEPVARLRLALLLLAALATGVAVAQAGAIGFVGLVVPHLLRLGGVVRMRQQSWAVPLAGAALLLLADAIARGVAIPYELPVGAVTSLLGAPLFILLLLREAGK
jgi:iron complex transport system permease protein